MELPQKIEAIGVAYLNTQAWPAYFSKALILPGEVDQDKTDQLIQVVCGESEIEDPPYSGNFWFPVEIQIRTPVTLQTPTDQASQDPAASTSQLAKHQAVADALHNAMVIDN